MKHRVALVGYPNTGKSTLFNRLTGAAAKVANWPGMTVELTTAKLLVGGHMVELVDLPGVHDLSGYSEDEAVVRRFLETTPVSALVLVLNAVQLDRQLALPLALRRTGVPLVLALNMSDEADKLGAGIDVVALESALGVPVERVSARRGTGLPELLNRLRVQFDRGATAHIADSAAFVHDPADDRTLEHLAATTLTPPRALSHNATTRLDRLFLHHLWGLPAFFVVMFVLFQAIYGLGTPLQDGMEAALGALRTWSEPRLTGLPDIARSFLLEGLLDGLGTVLTFLPLIVVFFLFMAALEDTGLLARGAFLTDALMHRLGLDGRAFVMQIMGFGCNVPALMGTRVMRDSRLRRLAMLVIPFSLCTARLQVFVFIAGAVFTAFTAGLALFALYLLSFAVALGTAWVFRSGFAGTDPLLLELPPYRTPSFTTLWRQGWQQSRHFLEGASGFIVLGVVLVWFLTHAPFGVVPASPESYAGRIADLARPLLAPLGFDAGLSVALIFGFVAKEIVIGALAVIYGAGESQLAHLIAERFDGVQAMSFMIFTLLYTPCVSAIATIRQESKSWAFTLLAVAWPLALAFAASFVFYQGARALGF